MRRAARARRAGKLVGAALAALAFVPVVLLPPVSGAAAAAPLHADRPAPRTSPLEVSLVRTTPWTPASSMSPRPLSFTVTLRNTTDAPVTHVVLRGFRGATVTTQQPLVARPVTALPATRYSIGSRPARSAGPNKHKSRAGTKNATIDVPVGIPVTATFRTTTGILSGAGLCLCTNGVYPVYLAAYDSRSGALDGFTRTYLSAVDRAPAGGKKYRKIGVAWLWPLIDRPHRLVDGRVFTDNDLATEIAPGGRLDRALQVVEDIGDAHATPITVLLDPDLIDELAVMSSGRYSYLSPGGRSVAGKDAAAAREWLSRLRAALADSNVYVQFTPYADPAIRSLTENGLSWDSQVPATMLRRVRSALGLQTLPSAVAWPPGGVDKPTLNQIAADGSTSVVLNAANVSPSSTRGVPSALVSVHTSHGRVSAALLSAATQKQIAHTIDDAHPDLSHLPDVLAQVAVRTAVQPYQHRSVLLSAPRYVDANPSAAERVIDETSSSAFSTPLSLDTELQATSPADLEHARVRSRRFPSPSLPAATTSVAASMRSQIPAVRSLLSGKTATPAALALVAELPRGLQRVESAGWLPGSTVGSGSDAAALSERLRGQVTGLLGGVRIVRPPDGRYTYTLASTNSPLPITVDNSLPYRAFVHIRVSSVAGLPGLTTRDLGVQPIAAQSKQTFRVPAHVTRSGRIQLFATLATANGHVLGRNVRLSVHSTVYGTIGIVITVAAGVILFFALVLRYIRRLSRLRRKRQPATDAAPTSEPVS